MQNQETAWSDTNKLKLQVASRLSFFFPLLVNQQQQPCSVKKSDGEISRSFPINDLHFKLLTSKSRGFFWVSELQTAFWAADTVTEKVFSCKSTRLRKKTLVRAPSGQQE